jgi:bifunctional ADP-heptose synthase (sugar kinase/adenylyltransferase)
MSMRSRLKPVSSLTALADAVASLKSAGKRVVHARGTLDLLERRDVARLRDAREGADAIVVTIAPGSGSHAPLLAADVRGEVVAALPFVFGVALEGGEAARKVIATIGADSVVEMDEPEPSAQIPASETSILDATGRGESADAKRVRSPSEADGFLRELRLRYAADDVIAALRKLKDLRVLVVGDAIIDEYHFVRPYGMALKAPIIASQFLEEEAYAGGILAVANHLAGFCDQVDLVTVLGGADSREPFVRSHLRANVRPTFFYRADAPTTVKRRYLGRFLLNKLFEVSFFDDRPLPPDVDAAVAGHLERACASYDLVVVADFGHGMLSPISIAALSARAKFLAVNAQVNSMNYGYHVVTKYDRADYVCIDEHEVRMAMRDRVTPVHRLLRPLAEKVSAKQVTVTLGTHGSATYRNDGVQVTVPILSRQVIDTVGAGDAYLAVSAPCVCVGMPPELVGFIGNAVGGLAVRIVGNKEPVGPDTLFPFIRALME